MDNLSNKLSIVVSSCDMFSECWEPYLHGINKYWPDCPYEIFIISNYRKLENSKAKFITVGEDKGWSGNLLFTLSKVETEFILYTHEDFWIKRLVDTSIIEEYLELMIKYNLNYIRLFPVPPPDFDFPFDNRLGILHENAEYRTSLQKAIWRKKTLNDLIDIGENAWQFERQGSLRSRKYHDKFLSVKNLKKNGENPFYGIDYVCTAINKGKWSRAAKEYAQAEGLDIDFSNRPHETWWHDFTRMNPFTEKIGRVAALSKMLVTDSSRFKQKLISKASAFFNRKDSRLDSN